MISNVPINVEPFGELSLYEVYISYDGPRVFTSKSQSGRIFFCKSIREDLPEDSSAKNRIYEEFIMVEVTPNRLAEIKKGSIGVNQAFLSPDGFTVYLAKTLHHPIQISATPIEASDLSLHITGGNPGQLLAIKS